MTLTFYPGTTSFADLTNPPTPVQAHDSQSVSNDPATRQEPGRPITRTVEASKASVPLRPLSCIGRTGKVTGVSKSTIPATWSRTKKTR